MIKKTHVQLIEPKLPEPFPNIPEYWTEPITGIDIPKDPTKNLEWRARLIATAENDPALQQYLFSCCEKSILFWMNSFVWTYRQFIVDPETHKPIPSPKGMAHVPFVTWQMQDEAILDMIYAVQTGEDIGIKKCRDTGASWMCLAVFHWFWLFRPDSQLLELSRNEDYVDKAGNAKSLFWKHDYINQWLPDWMMPPDCLPGSRNRSKMHVANELNGSVIDGESTTAKAASGDRRLAVLLDEFAKVDNGQAMRSATADVTPCRIVNSTPFGAGTEYSKWLSSGQIKVIYLPFFMHPEKGAGRFIRKDPVTGMFEIRSPWLENEELRRSPKEMAQEIFMDDLESGSTFFECDILEKHKLLFGRKPRSTIQIDFEDTVPNAEIRHLLQARSIKKIYFNHRKLSPMEVWPRLINGRLDQKYTYTLGIDISEGKGASNSVISVFCIQTQEKVAEWADARTPPYELARIAMAVALWVGGANPHRLPVICWEMNGPGYDFGKMVVEKYMYPYCYYMESVATREKKKDRKYGWHASKERKELLLSQYRRYLAHGGIINRSIKALDEAEYYIRYPEGQIGPSCLLEESSAARKTHGDRVIADALALEAAEKKLKRKVGGAEVPKTMRSAAYRKQMHKQQTAEQKRRTKSWRKDMGYK